MSFTLQTGYALYVLDNSVQVKYFGRKQMKKKLSCLIYKIIKFMVWIFYPKTTAKGTENLPEEPCIIVGNHAQMNGPICCELYSPTKSFSWCAGEMMHLREVPAYAFSDFWSQKPKSIRWFYKILSYVIAPLSVCVFNNAKTIGVYHDSRILATFKETIRTLENGSSIVIFPEHNHRYNNILWDFQDRFIDVAKMYYRKTGKAISFVPMYIAPKLKAMYLGKAIKYCPESPIEAERQRIKKYLMEEITNIANGLPVHTVIPYPNISKSKYPSNICETEE